MANSNAITFGQFWACLFGDMTPEQVVSEFTLVYEGLGEWLGTCASAAWEIGAEGRDGAPIPEDWKEHHATALQKLEIAISANKVLMALAPIVTAARHSARRILRQTKGAIHPLESPVSRMVISINKATKDLERLQTAAAFVACEGHQERTAELLGVTRATVSSQIGKDPLLGALRGAYGTREERIHKNRKELIRPHWSELRVWRFDGSNEELDGSMKLRKLREFRDSITMCDAVFCDPSECSEEEAIEAGPASAADIFWGERDGKPAFGTYSIQRNVSGNWSSYGLGDATGWETIEAALRASRSLKALGDEWVCDYRIVDCFGKAVADTSIDSFELFGLKPELFNADTAQSIREATPDELQESLTAAESDGGRGIISVDGVRCYVL